MPRFSSIPAERKEYDWKMIRHDEHYTYLGVSEIPGRFNAEERLRGASHSSGALSLLSRTPRNVRDRVADESDLLTGRVEFGQRVSEPR